MPEQDDHSYLSRQLITDTDYIIEDNEVKISCPSTLFVHEVLNPPIKKEKVLSLYKRVLTLAKEKNVSISYRAHIHRNIKERWEEYVTACDSMKALFAQIIKQSRVVKERGLHYGTVDDQALKRLQYLCWKYQEFHHRSSVASLVSSILHRLESLAEDLSEPECRWDQITL